MKRQFFIALSFALGLGACATTKAPGTSPGDMTAAQHHQACLDHKKQSEASAQQATNLNGGKGTYTAATEADRHADVAKQHGDAAKAVDPQVNDCD
jgi:hypothetical protein